MEDLSGWKVSCVYEFQDNIPMMTTLSNMNYRFCATLIRIPMALRGNGKTRPKIHMEPQGTQNEQQSYKRRTRLKDRFTVPGFKSHGKEIRNQNSVVSA